MKGFWGCNRPAIRKKKEARRMEALNVQACMFRNDEEPMKHVLGMC